MTVTTVMMTLIVVVVAVLVVTSSSGGYNDKIDCNSIDGDGSHASGDDDVGGNQL